MEGLANWHQVLDACSVINLLYIDEDEFLLRKLDKRKFNLCRIVFEEVHNNVFKKFKNSTVYANLQMKNLIKEIEIKLVHFRNRIFFPEDYMDLTDEVEVHTGYSKRNGEFISVSLSYYLAKYEEKNVIFYTDDFPAKYFFQRFFESHEIGEINDTIDLLFLLFQSNDDFSKNDLKKYYSSLYSEYALEISELQREMFSLEIPKHFIRNVNFRRTLDLVLLSLKEVDINGIYEQYNFVNDNKAEFRPLYDVMSKYRHFFGQRISNEFLNKLKTYHDKL